MDKDSLILMALSTADMQTYTLSQVQKLIFLIQKKLPSIVEKGFDFQPCDYGPFDKSMHWQLKRLNQQGAIEMQQTTKYSLTAGGLEKGKKYFNTLEDSEQRYIERLSKFARELSFSELVASIYKAYPEMRENSVFKEYDRSFHL